MNFDTGCKFVLMYHNYIRDLCLVEICPLFPGARATKAVFKYNSCFLQGIKLNEKMILHIFNTNISFL